VLWGGVYQKNFEFRASSGEKAPHDGHEEFHEGHEGIRNIALLDFRRESLRAFLAGCTSGDLSLRSR
jgi:hypothetical protein